MRSGMFAGVTALAVAAASPLSAQSLSTESNIETDAQLVSSVASGTPPLAVSSSTTVRNLSADFLDGKHGNAFALAVELLAAMESLDNPDPPCFDLTHRFVDCNNGTVTDTVTGLIYLKDASCGELPGTNLSGAALWVGANEAAAALEDGICGLTDGSRPGDWRLSTREEWEGILDSSCTDAPKIVGNQSPTPGCYTDGADTDSEWASGVGEGGFFYWSSTTRTNATAAWNAKLNTGSVDSAAKGSLYFVWPVRSGLPQQRIKSVNCPAGEFVSGFDTLGELICTAPP